ncbi:MAG: hypothetical protein A3H98_12605 [Bacteroidetes bacterium RIFCSPLOWO2_02_FULL_36_8]|nr:MAG: hypothetical protein A3H98_12605 [Bacteroidetes bacterium RIFCSPLOWO2_02_FULL_36_8]OFY69971.1 MAG: hypothetical protein A3G23_05815 [Bacteroidetes bacterium RIFCSPLOWO2_12_FULL_37_12]
MTIRLENISKRFQKHWVFREINFCFSTGNIYAITGKNGSGKSTLLQIISGFLSPNSGSVQYMSDTDIIISSDEIFEYVSLVSPEMELYDEMNLEEIIDFHFSFKKMQNDFNRTKIIELLNFTSHLQKPIKSFSTGMKQKLKLALGFYASAPVLLLDEPISNLDDTAITWYLEQLQKFTAGRLVIIASNQWVEKEMCRGGEVGL